jgi:glycosyltransferase involved in cell wall biosynthesis
MISVSLVVPVYSGEAYLRRLVEAVDDLRQRWLTEGAPINVAELILVDDCAIDGSPALLDVLAKEESWVIVLHLARNFGQHPATAAGILHSSGDWVVTLDEDLQHPPSGIPDLLRMAVERRSDTVYGWAESGVHESIVRDFGSRAYKRLLALVTGSQSIRHVSSFRLMRGAVARAAAAVCTPDTYFDVAVSWFTQRIDFFLMPLKDERYIAMSKSGYKFRSLFSHARRLLFSSNLKVLRLTTFLGVAVFIASVIGGLYLIFYKLTVTDAIPVAGWTSLILTVGLLCGFIIVTLGVLLEYMAILIQRALGRPLFFVIDRESDAELLEYFLTQPK